MQHYDEVFRRRFDPSLTDPVSVTSVLLERELFTQDLAAVLELCKNRPEEICRVDAVLFLRDEEERLIAGPVTFRYAVPEDTEREFGGDFVLELPDMEAVSAEAYVKRVLFADGRIWENSSCPDEAVELYIGQEEEQPVQKKEETAPEVPETEAAAAAAAEIPEEEPVPAAPPEKKERKPLSKKTKKILALAGGGIAAAAGIALLIVFVIIPAVRYKNAGELMDAGSYQEAAEVYAVLEDYKDSPDRRNLSNALNQIREGGYAAGIENILSRGMNIDIAYTVNGGKFTEKGRTENASYAQGSRYEGLPVMEKDYYTFTGWQLGSEGYTVGENGFTAQVTLEAQYTPIEYSLTYEGLKDGTQSNPATYNVETPDIKLKDGVRTGYTFTGWEGETTDGAEKEHVIRQGSHGDQLFNACWEPNVYVISLTGNGEKAKGGKAFKDQQMNVTFDAAYTLPEMEKSGFDYAGWTDGTEAYSKGTWKRASDVTLTPVFELHKYKLSYDLCGGELQGTNPENFTVEQPDITFSGATRFGYDFVGWTWDTQTTPMNPGVLKKGSTGDKVITAVWKGHEHTVKMDPKGGNLSSDTAKVVFGDEYTLPAPSKTGYSFQGWSDGKTTYDKGVWDLDQDISVTAGWQAKSYNVPLNYAGGSGGAASLSVTYDKSYSLPEASRTGYDFLGWFIGDSQVSGGTWTIDGAPTIEARWQPKVYNVQLNADGGDVSQSSLQVTFGTAYTLPTPVRKGYTFNGWTSGGTSYGTSGTWNTASDVSLTAKWTRTQYVIKLDTNGGRASKSRVQVYYGESYSLPTPYQSGYTFDGWYCDGEEFPSSGTYDYAESITVTAEWTSNRKEN